MDKITIELIEQTEETYKTEEWSGWKVSQGDRYADGLCFDEMIGLLCSLTLPQTYKPHLTWMKTKAEHKQWRDNLKKNKKKWPNQKL